jgi:hypothetical protein
VKRIQASETQPVVRELQTANEVRGCVSNFEAQRRQDDPARGAIGIEARAIARLASAREISLALSLRLNADATSTRVIKEVSNGLSADSTRPRK